MFGRLLSRIPLRSFATGSTAPLKPYQAFMKTEIARVKGANPTIKHTEAFKQAASNWKNAPSNPKNTAEKK